MKAPELLQRLISFNTVNPPGNEGEALEFLKGMLDEAGWNTELLAKVPERPNLVARLKGAAPGPTLGLISHDHRTAIVETYLRDRSYDDVAAELGVSVSTLRSRVFHGLKQLRLASEMMVIEQ